MAGSTDKVAIAFKLEGAPSDEGLVRFSDFRVFIDGALTVLNALEREATNERRARIEYRITQLDVGSATLTIEPIATGDNDRLEQHVATRFAEGLSAIRDGLSDLAPFSPQVRSGFARMVSPLRRSVRSIVATVGDAAISVMRGPSGVIALDVASAETAAVGSVSGSVDALNVHGDFFFYLYPPVGPTRIKCVFDPALLEEVREAVKRYCTVRGLIEYLEPSSFPARIVVDHLVAHPDESKLPKLSDLWGIAPDLTGGLDEVEFVRRQRNGE